MIDYNEVNDRIFCDFCNYVENKYHVNLEEVMDDEDEQQAKKLVESFFCATLGSMADDIGQILINVVKDTVNTRLKEFGYEQTIPSGGSEEETGDLQGNC